MVDLPPRALVLVLMPVAMQCLRTCTCAPQARAFWLDDANSTGSSLRDGVQLLKNEYNIEVETALYLVDRSADRKTLPLEKIGLADPSVTKGAS